MFIADFQVFNITNKRTWVYILGWCEIGWWRIASYKQTTVAIHIEHIIGTHQGLLFDMIHYSFIFQFLFNYQFYIGACTIYHSLIPVTIGHIFFTGNTLGTVTQIQGKYGITINNFQGHKVIVLISSGTSRGGLIIVAQEQEETIGIFGFKVGGNLSFGSQQRQCLGCLQFQNSAGHKLHTHLNVIGDLACGFYLSLQAFNIISQSLGHFFYFSLLLFNIINCFQECW